MSYSFGPRRGRVIGIEEILASGVQTASSMETERFSDFDLVYRSLCALMYNFVPQSGHPGGSISSGRIVQGLLFGAMDYDASNPEAPDADIISYAAGHKALGLYALWALRNEVMRAGAPGMLPADLRLQLRLEDLLGFRRNPTSLGPIAEQFAAKALDGHPTPATPFVKLSTGASGVGVASSFGLALALADRFGDRAPFVHVIEGEGGMTPGRVAEALAAAGTMGLSNLVLHVDWNQSSIDSDRVCRESDVPGDYVQWDPIELCHLHDWNVIVVPDGRDFAQILTAQRFAVSLQSTQPTAIVYRTVKGWNYGIEGRASHGAGHALCSESFYQAVVPLTDRLKASLPHCDAGKTPCRAGADSVAVEACYWEALETIRSAFIENPEMTAFFVSRLEEAKAHLIDRARKPREGAPRIDALYEAASRRDTTPDEVRVVPGSQVALRAALGKVLSHLNRASGGAILAAAADLLGSTSLNVAADGFAKGFFHRSANPGARLLSIGGICEDAMCGMLAGAAAIGHHAPAGSSYGAFIAALGHIAARLHGIGGQARHEIVDGAEHNPWFLVCAHAGLKTGEDGPTHADPQPLQLLQENFPKGVAITLTPWDPQEVWPLVSEALTARPAVIAPFVTRPNEPVLDRVALGLAPAEASRTGVYALLGADPSAPVDATVVLQGSEVAYAFVLDAWPILKKRGLNVRAFYVASAELFDLLPRAEQSSIFPAHVADSAMGITGFTLPTMYRWIRSERGREHTLHPFKHIGYPGSGQGAAVMEQAGLDGRSQARAIERFARES